MFWKLIMYVNALAPPAVCLGIILALRFTLPTPEPIPPEAVRQAPPEALSPAPYPPPYRPLVLRSEAPPIPTREEYERLVRRFSDTD